MSKFAAAVLSLICLILFVLPSSAQILPSGNVYVGGAHAYSDIVVNKYDFWGWNASAEAIPFSRHSFISVVLDGSGFYRPGITQYNFLIGPRLSVSYGKWRPFVHAMAGLQMVKSDGNTYRPLGIDFGGGVDRKLPFKNFSWRLQADYVHSRYLSANDSEIRGSTGIVWRF
ncbi:MAG TPA: hypothetical protein VI386_20355 [Candidatus Sulfotelmatobacter sp.]